MKRILIANRSEIALRVLNTCRRMGIETVTVYADDDKDFIYNSLSDYAISLGSGALSDTYLNIEKLIKIAKDYACDGVHPGYGFLSENTDFAAACDKAGVKFIGPKADAINLMGDKTQSKIAMEKAGIPLIPGYHGDNQDPEFLKAEAKKIGYPVLVKASAGGGGKGMRIIKSENDFNEGLASAKREAKNAFGNDHVLIEKFIEVPRHIEVQVLSDQHGNHLHFYERDCSVQRRHQKIIEETPAPGMSAELQQDMCETAAKIAKSINYEGAGTVEYILDTDGSFYFLEMNTRLQVEHPITEMVTGTDLVELQIRVARGEKLEIRQEDITQMGHALEVRLYAEDPDNEFLPTVGRVMYMGGSDIPHRFECAYVPGQNVNINYDPMLAKYITYAGTREESLDDMVELLNDRPFFGIKTNNSYLKRVLTHPDFEAGNIDTNFVKNHVNALNRQQVPRSFLVGEFFATINDYEPGNGFRVVSTAVPYKMVIDGEEVSVTIKQTRSGVEVTIGDEVAKVPWRAESNVFLDKSRELYNFLYENEIYEIQLSASAGKSIGAGENDYFSPMPGKILKVCTVEGADVEVDSPLVILEAMKMEHVIKSNIKGKVKKIHFAAGQSVQSETLLVELEGVQ